MVSFGLVIAGAAIATLWVIERNTKEKIQALEGRCVQAMISQTCGISNRNDAPASTSSVFVAGTGRIDSQVYSELKSLGDQMCTRVSTSCSEAWNGTTCQIARVLYP